MKVVVAPNAFKGSLSAAEAARAMSEGVSRLGAVCHIVEAPVADGGDGLAEILTGVMNGQMRTVTVRNPLGEPVEADYCLTPDVAAIEMATASGLALLSSAQLNPLLTSTYGTGELLADALAQGVKRIIVGIGGSATNDGGIGMAAALGVKFLDSNGEPVGCTGGDLEKINRIDLSCLNPAVRETLFEVACDVDNPLLGEHGAARVYAPQKGADPGQVERLEAGLANLAAVISRDLGIEVRDLPGGGAAGGLGAGLHAFLGAKLRPGVELVLDLVGLDKKLEGADLVLTAEGRLDRQTAFGKAPAGVAKLAKAHGIPCFAFAGGISGDVSSLRDVGITAVFPICREPMKLEQAMRQGYALLADATEQAVRAYLAGLSHKV